VAVFDLRELSDDDFVIHFGGAQNQVDAGTLGNALLALSDAIKAINDEINPGYTIAITVSAFGPGSFRARVKTEKRKIGSLFSASKAVDYALGALVAILIERAIFPAPSQVVEVYADNVVVTNGDNQIVISKDVFESKEKAKRSPLVNKSISRTMETLEEDQAIKSFGITPRMSDPNPSVDFPRDRFPIIKENSQLSSDSSRRTFEQPVVLVVHKAVFERSTRKWEFSFSGFKISAPILDPTFFDRLSRGEIAIRQGDAFEAVLKVYQVYDPIAGSWMNERYEVTKVGPLVSRIAEQTGF